jgi:hypothetical protein
VTYPGVSLSTACFAHGIYEENAAALCFSNLLATGFRRFILDLYWDAGRRAWSFCPVELPSGTAAISATGTSAASAAASTVSLSSTVSITNSQITRRAAKGTLTAASTCAKGKTDGEGRDDGDVLLQRQTTPTSGASTAASGSSHELTISTPTSTAAVSPNLTASGNSTAVSPIAVPSNGATLIRNGPYECTSSIDLLTFTSVLNQYLHNSSTTLAAIMTFVELKVHVAAPIESPSSPAQSLNTSTVPAGEELLKNAFNVNLSSFLYTPTMLRNDRTDLNTSWFSISPLSQPDGTFFNSSLDERHVLTTDNGWPSESYVEFTKAYRMMASFRSLDPQLALYNLTADEDIIFPPGALEAGREIAYNTAGMLDQGCFFTNSSTDLSAANNSWAITSSLDLPPTFLTTNITQIPPLSNLTNCGISPLLNTTLSNTTADQNILPYQSFAYNSIWSWAFSEPRNVSASEPNSDRIRCALLDTALSGRWRVADCTEHHYAACRTTNQPYIWKLSGSRGGYSSSGESCPDDTTFTAPRSGLENTYLNAAANIRRSDSGSGGGDTTFWINFNSLDVAGCWVSDVNATCPYTSSANGAAHGRQVIVPVVAAIIVFVIAALTFFVKCAANRRNSKRGRRRRRADDGWDYEGVPS